MLLFFVNLTNFKKMNGDKWEKVEENEKKTAKKRPTFTICLHFGDDAQRVLENGAFL